MRTKGGKSTPPVHPSSRRRREGEAKPEQGGGQRGIRGIMYVGIMYDGLMFAWGVCVRVPKVRHCRKVGDSETQDYGDQTFRALRWGILEGEVMAVRLGETILDVAKHLIPDLEQNLDPSVTDRETARLDERRRETEDFRGRGCCEKKLMCKLYEKVLKSYGSNVSVREILGISLWWGETFKKHECRIR